MDKSNLFKRINANMLRFAPSLGDNIYCPVCWKQFTPEDIKTELSLEHVPPSSASKLIKEKTRLTLTCHSCNNTYGTKYQNDLKNFLIFQLWQKGKYDGYFPGNVSIAGSPTLNCNITWNPIDKNKPITIIGVPKANNPITTEGHLSLIKSFAEKQEIGWGIKIEGSFRFKQDNIWAAYLHLAYLSICIRTGYMYAFTEAGILIRKLIAENSSSQIGPCIIPGQIGDVDSWPWLAQINAPSELSCLWVKVAGNIVILPKPDNKDLTTLYKNWRYVSKEDILGIIPQNISLTLEFITNQDIIEAKKSLPNLG
jgi:hypothetical protein